MENNDNSIFVVREASSLPKEFNTLVQSSVSEGHEFVRRTLSDWDQRLNCFDKKGEIFLLGYYEGKLVGCCGLNIDPYTDESNIARIRHLYVLPSYRRRGIAKVLTNHCIDRARNNFKVVRLRANSLNSDSFFFYDSIGFKRSENNEFETHRLNLEI